MVLSKNLTHLNILLTILLSSGCQHEFINSNMVEFSSIEFSEKISNEFKEKSKQYLKINKELENSSLLITKLTFKKRTLYGGLSARAKEIEILGELHFQFTSPVKKQPGIITAVTQMPSNEVNPQAEISAQRQLKGQLEFILLEDLVQEYWLIEG
tara:strand:- start:397 stop:861 length:465 start_codon:yes stop_codon:yes gene_type:complete